MSHRIHKLWLKVAAVLVCAFAPIAFLGTMPATNAPAELSIDILDWPLDGGTNFDTPDMRFLSALIAGFLIGWGVMIWRLSGAAYDAAPEAVRKAVLTSFLAWFILDGAASVTAGVPINAFFNLIVLIIGIGPLWRPAREDA